ncbi:WhiB family transcriptional regulator [Brachybacterium tyrofermentans]|uniref:WhiB family transcriptional regulator n=1 Tax=Brachybacterium tyrofermentans TaxID=47848 RepID=UPI003F937E0D
MILPNPEPWMADATCAQIDGDLWFPEVGANPQAAKRICLEQCPVREQCLAYALENDEQGVWGGLSRNQRKALQAKQETA